MIYTIPSNKYRIIKIILSHWCFSHEFLKDGHYVSGFWHFCMFYFNDLQKDVSTAAVLQKHVTLEQGVVVHFSLADKPLQVVNVLYSLGKEQQGFLILLHGKKISYPMEKWRKNSRRSKSISNRNFILLVKSNVRIENCLWCVLPLLL